MDLAGKTAVVTGASSGLGEHIARRLAAAGAIVAVNYASSEDAARAVVSGIEQRGGQAFAAQARLGGVEGARQLAETLDRQFTARCGTTAIDILVNNIGGGDYAPFLDVTEEQFDHEISNNVRAAFFLIQQLHGRLADNGRVINISSAGARLTDLTILPYTLAKAALEAMTRTLAVELGPRGITVNAVGPGFTAGPTNAHVTEDPVLSKQVMDATALKRFGQPEEIADIVLALASPLGRWVTAQTIDASGGFKL
jgi:NAD(P)-dependent dehydrogenase (short-subunit alcohol dehydrogenase family)